MQAPSALSAFRRRLPGEADRLFADDLVSECVPARLLAAPPPAPVFAEMSALAHAIVLAAPSRVGGGAAQAMLADRAAATYGLTGKGVKIGILSDSFDLKGGLAENIKRGEIGRATILKEGPRGGSDEGRAMAELIHKIAPDAEVVFYSAFWGEADFAKGIRALAAAGCSVIVDDVTYLAEPFFQEGANVQCAVQQVVSQGVNYFTAAGNAGANFYQAGFSAVKAALPGLTGSYLVQNFGSPGAPKTLQSLTIARGATTTLSLQWDQPFASIGSGRAAANSLGMVLYDSNNKIVAYTLANDVGGNPTQTLQFTNNTASTGFRLAIIANGGTSPPALFKYIAYGQGTVINDPNAGRGSGTLTGHELVAEANTVGAMAYYNAKVFGGSQIMQSFSSVGPGALLFDAKGNRMAAPAAATGVDFTAPDGAATSVFAPFFGTSAAAPNAAAVAAMMLQINPSLTPSQISTLLAASATPVIGAPGAGGAGLIQATTAVQLARLAPKAGAVMTLADTAGLGASLSGAALRSTADAAAALQTDPTSTADLTAIIDLASGVVAGDVQTMAAGLDNAWAMLSSGAMLMPFDTSQTGFTWG